MVWMKDNYGDASGYLHWIGYSSPHQHRLKKQLAIRETPHPAIPLSTEHLVEKKEKYAPQSHAEENIENQALKVRAGEESSESVSGVWKDR